MFRRVPELEPGPFKLDDSDPGAEQPSSSGSICLPAPLWTEYKLDWVGLDWTGGGWRTEIVIRIMIVLCGTFNFSLGRLVLSWYILVFVTED